MFKNICSFAPFPQHSTNPRHPAAISRQSRVYCLTSAGSGVAAQKGTVVLHIYGQKTSKNKEQFFCVGFSHLFGG